MIFSTRRPTIDLQESPDFLETDYYQIYGELRLGDVLMFVDECGEAFHSAVSIANDIVFTKNGPDALRPWCFADARR